MSSTDPSVISPVAAWRRGRASRVSFLIDGAAYYAALASALERARRSILLVGWDIDSRTLLRRINATAETFSGLLNRVVSRNRELHAHLLPWDFSLFFVLERQLFPAYHFGIRTHRRVHFRLDSDHPFGAGQHQKIVVIDDKIAFCGGLDITTHRWDTRQHAPGDPRRRDPTDAIYEPFHDVQLAADAEVARALGDLCRERWRRATGEALKPPQSAGGDPWPPELVPDMADVDIDIARTEPSFPARGRPGVFEVEQSFLAAIASAKQSIYIENQYTTSAVIAEALAARLAEKCGPEVVMVVPRRCSGWLEAETMGALRARLFDRLVRADKEGRLRVYYPRVREGVDVFVHSKVLVIDRSIARVGSANLSGRSMRVDTECDLSICARGDARIEAGIARVRDQLLAEHLGAVPSRVAAAIEAEGSLVRGIEALRDGSRTLIPIDLNAAIAAAEEPDPILELAVDPERPIQPDQVADSFFMEEPPVRRVQRLSIRAAVVIALALALMLVRALFEPSHWPWVLLH